MSIGLDIRKSFDDGTEECSLLSMVPTSSASCSSMVTPGPGASGSKQMPAPGQGGPKPKRAKLQQPAHAASKVRKESLRLFMQVQGAAETALALGKVVLSEGAAEHGGVLAEAIEADTMLKSLDHRMHCLRLLMDSFKDARSSDRSAHILEELNKDDYFRDQQWHASHVHTLGFMKYVREVMLDLQRSSDAVDAMGQAHRDAIGVLKEVASAVTKDASEWRAQVAALRKARELEQKTLEREAERQRKADEKKAAKEEKKAKAAAEKEKAAAEKKRAAAAAAAAGEEGEGGTKKRRKRQATEGIDKEDKALLQCVVSPDFPKESTLTICETFMDLAEFIGITGGMVAAVVRCRRSSIKKVFEAR